MALKVFSFVFLPHNSRKLKFSNDKEIWFFLDKKMENFVFWNESLLTINFPQNCPKLISSVFPRFLIPFWFWFNCFHIVHFSWIRKISPITMLSPHEMFMGSPAWRFELLPELATNPETYAWASQRLKELRKEDVKCANKGRVEAIIQEDDYLLVHNKRFPPGVLKDMYGSNPTPLLSCLSHRIYRT